MSILDELRSARTKSMTSYMDFIQVKNSYDIIIFCEGIDDMLYYEPIIKCRAYGYTYKMIDCHGKTNVVDIENKIEKEKIEKKILYYFVDKDFDDNNFSFNIYVTPTYSIENLYFTDIAIRKFLEGIMHISPSNSTEVEDLENVYNYLLRVRDDSLNKILEANAIYSLQKRKSMDCDSACQANLEGIKKYNDIKDKSKAEIINIIENLKEMSDDEINSECIRLSENLVGNIRGKYILEIMKKHYSHVVEELNYKPNRNSYIYLNPQPSRRYHVSFNPESENLLRSLSGYSDIPRDLIQYLDNKLSE